jgi:hypothetical protein
VLWRANLNQNMEESARHALLLKEVHILPRLSPCDALNAAPQVAELTKEKEEVVKMRKEKEVEEDKKALAEGRAIPARRRSTIRERAPVGDEHERFSRSTPPSCSWLQTRTWRRRALL